MAENSKIEWTHHTANLWWGCTKVHAGCDNCYAEYFSDVRYKKNLWGKDSPRQAIKSVWGNFMSFQAKAASVNEIHRVFVGSMMDIFEKSMPLVDSNKNPIEGNTGELRDKFFNEVIPSCPNLMFLLLTKRPSNINKMIPDSWKENPPENVIFGTSPVDQETSENLIPHLLKVKGRRFLSVEPQLNSINIQGFLFHGGIDWVIQGGESGSNKRPFNLDWAYYLKQQCEVTGTPYFFKQIDKVQEIPEDLLVREFYKETTPSV